MAGRRPILASLITNLIWGTRDFLFKVTLEPVSHDKRRAKQAAKKGKNKEEGN